MSESAVISEFWAIVRSRGIHDGLRFLNDRTPHRFTAIYRYDGDMLRSVHFYDQFTPSLRKGADVKMVDAYCALVGERRAGVQFADINVDRSIDLKPDSPVVSYCGALITDDNGKPYGTLCHFDTKPAQHREDDIPILEAIARMIYSAIKGEEKSGVARPSVAPAESAPPG
jgi:hypothetical protein